MLQIYSMKPMAHGLVAVLMLVAGPAYGEDKLVFSRPEIRLWPNGAPGSEGQTSPETWNPSIDGFHRVTNINDPSMVVFLPPKAEANGVAVVICPGGGHQYLVMDLEGSMVAERLNSMGIAAFLFSRAGLPVRPVPSIRLQVMPYPTPSELCELSEAGQWNGTSNPIE